MKKLEKEKNRIAKISLKISFFIIAFLGINILLAMNNHVHAAINNTINFQTRITNKTTGLSPVTGTPACVSSGADTCDFRVRIWNVVSGGTATAGNNLLLEELFTNIEIGDFSGRLDLKINSVCAATISSTHSWGTSGTSATLCNLFDDNGDADSTTGVNFDRSDLFLEITFDPSGTWTSLASPPGGIETFSRTSLLSVPAVFNAQSLSGIAASGFVQLSPSAVQSTTSSTPAIWVRQQGTGTTLQLQKSGTDYLIMFNNDILSLTQTGSTAGLVIGGDANLYRSAAATLKTDGGLIVNVNMQIEGLSDFKGDIRGLLLDGDGTTTTTGTGTSLKNLAVSSSSNFDTGNLVLINGATYARIDGTLTGGTLRVTPAVTWTASQTVVEKILPQFGDTGNSPSLMMTNFFVDNSFTAGLDSTGTTYKNGNITSTVGLEVNSAGTVQIDSSGFMNLNTLKGINVNKNESTAPSSGWSTVDTSGGLGRNGATAVFYNGKSYYYGGVNGAATDTLDIYDFATNTWSTGAASGTARTDHSAVVYNDKMYVYGGTVSGSVVNTMDVYTFATNSWAAGSAGGTSKRYQTTTVYNGKMYSYGGFDGSVAISTLDIYDFAGNNWTTGASGSTIRQRHTAVLFNGRIYVYGGRNNLSVLTSIESYDVASNTWTTKTAGIGRTQHVATVYRGKMYAYGGSGTATSMEIYDIALDSWSTGTAGSSISAFGLSTVYGDAWYIEAFKTLYRYSFGTTSNLLTVNVGTEERLALDSNNVLTVSGKPLGLNYITNDLVQYNAIAWSTGTSIGTARVSPHTVTYNNKIYVWGGATNTASSTYTNTLEIYDIGTNTWSTGTAGGTARKNGGAVVYNGKIYNFGGCTNAGCTTYATAVDVYNIATDSWSTATTGGTSRGGPTTNLYNGKVYIWSGCTGACANVNTLDIYDIPTDSWSTGTAGGTARRNAGSAVYNGKIYNYGGITAGVINTLDIYDIASGTWTTGLAGGTARSLPNVNIYNGKLYSTHGFTTVGVNTTDIYDIEKNVWTTGLAGGTASWTTGSVIVGSNIYVISGMNTNSTVMLNIVDILNLGFAKVDDIFYIKNTNTDNSAAGPENGKLFRFDATGRAYTSTQGGWFSVGADYAEYMHTEDPSIGAADIVCLDPSDGKSIVKAKEGDSNIVGVISTEPGFVGNIRNVEDINSQNPNYKLMSMVGQVPVKVKGDIKVGDKVTASNIQGVGRKAKDGETNIGIAQENHTSESIDVIQILMTRNNDGINNKVEIDFGRKSEGGFRVSVEGKMQYRDEGTDWKNVADSSSVSKALLWEQKGDNVFAAGESNVAIGLNSASNSGSKLQVGNDFESKDGLNFVKVSASGKISFNQDDVGFRVNQTTNEIEFRDSTTTEWKSLSGLVISRIRFEKDNQIDLPNQIQISGWGYLEADGINSQLLKTINFPVEYNYQPLVSLGIIGESVNKPEKASDCSDVSSTKKVNSSEVSKTSFKVNITVPVEVGKYYCYTWLAN